MRYKDGIAVPLIRLGIRVAKARRWALRAVGLMRRRVSIEPQMKLAPAPIAHKHKPGTIAAAVYDAWNETQGWPTVREPPPPPVSRPSSRGPGRPVTWYADQFKERA